MSDYDILKQKVISVNRDHPEWIKEIKINHKNLFVVNTEKCKNIDITNKLHLDIFEQCSAIIADVIQLMKKDSNFKNFICVNSQFLFETINQNPHFKEFVEPLELIDDTGNLVNQDQSKKIDVVHTKLFGFIKSGTQHIDETKQEYFERITKYYKKNLAYLLYVDEERIDFDLNIKKPFKQLIQILNINSKDITEETGYIELNAMGLDSEKLQSFFTALQLHIFFEQYIKMIIESEIKQRVIMNPLICFNPSYNDKRNQIDGYYELDGLLYVTTEGNIIIVECKNTFKINQPMVTKFIGTCCCIERVYGVQIYKCFVSTGVLTSFWRWLWKYSSFKDLKIFSKSDYDKNYGQFKSYLRSLT